ncbi:MAG: type IV secretory system conjugative DNA transfer family protein, partial [Oscillospiraceae bacterium]
VVECYRLIGSRGGGLGVGFLNEVELTAPESITARRYSTFKQVMAAEKTWGCINQFVTNALNQFYIGEVMDMLQQENSLRIEAIGNAPTALFVNVSDSDRSLDGLVNIFYTQCLRTLIKEADKNPNSRLRVPVRLVLDDFAASTIIPDFDNLISIIRSRDIYVSVILQSLTQLDSKYGVSNARTIINNCDHIIYLGVSDSDTCDYIANRSGMTPDKIMYMPLDKEILIERGSRGRFVDKVKPYSFTESGSAETPQG